MASLLIRNLSDEVKKRLRIRAAENGRSMEEEGRLAIEAFVRDNRAEKPDSKMSWVEELRASFAEVGFADDLVIPPREPMPEPINFDDESSQD